VNALYGRWVGEGYPRRPQPEAGRRHASYKSRAPSGRASAASGCGRTGVTRLRQLRRGIAGTSGTASSDAVEPATRVPCRALREKREMCSLRRGHNVILPGQYYDAETGLTYNYFRDYDPGIGRYVEDDPIGLAGGSYSTYAYAGGDPVGLFDVTGLVTPGVDPKAQQQIATDVAEVGIGALILRILVGQPLLHFRYDDVVVSRT